jgi:hypothetical protein
MVIFNYVRQHSLVCKLNSFASRRCFGKWPSEIENWACERECFCSPASTRGQPCMAGKPRSSGLAPSSHVCQGQLSGNLRRLDRAAALNSWNYTENIPACLRNWNEITVCCFTTKIQLVGN